MLGPEITNEKIIEEKLDMLEMGFYDDRKITRINIPYEDN